jgi:hypothetical protein
MTLKRIAAVVLVGAGLLGGTAATVAATSGSTWGAASAPQMYHNASAPLGVTWGAAPQMYHNA